MSASPITMMMSATASTSGVGSAELAPEAADAFSAMVSSTEAATSDGQELSAETKTGGKTADALSAEDVATDMPTADGGVSANLLAGAALYMIQPQPIADGQTGNGSDASAMSLTTSISPPTFSAGPEVAAGRQLPTPQTDAHTRAGATTPPSPSIAGLQTGETVTASPGPEAETLSKAMQQTGAAAPPPSFVKPVAKAPELTAPVPPMAAAPDEGEALARAAAAAAMTVGAAHAPTAAAQPLEPAVLAPAAKSSPDKIAAPSLKGVTADAEAPPVARDDSRIVVAPPVPPKAAFPQTPAAIPAPAQPAVGPLRAPNAAASERTLSAVVSTDASAEAASGVMPTHTSSVAPPVVALAPTTPTLSAPPSGAADPALEPLADMLAPVAPDSPNANAAAPTTAPANTVAAAVSQSLSTLSRATIETTAQIAAQITRRLDGRSTRFEMKLAPEGLGNVDISLDIGADGQLAARLAFDNPLAATELRGRADELRRQLEDAGFTLARDALDFAERDPSSSSGGDGFDRRQNSRAFTDASRLAAEADAAIPPPTAWVSLSLTPRGVDMKV